MGTYQQFSAGGETIGGMFTKPPTLPLPFWLYYFNVADIEAAAKRVEAGGGEILYGPMEVPGGAWIVHCADPQGAIFALLDRRARKPSAITYLAIPTGANKTAKQPYSNAASCVCNIISSIWPCPKVRAAAEHKLTDRAFDVEVDPRHPREEIDIGDPDRASAEPHIRRHQIERLHQDADVLQNRANRLSSCISMTCGRSAQRW